MKGILSRQAKGYLLIFAAGICWGTIGLFVNLLSETGANSGLIAFMRISTGALMLAPVMLIKEGRESFKLNRRGLICCLILGVFSEAVFNLSYNGAIARNGVATSAVLLYTAPIFVCILSAVLFKEKIGGMKIFALIIDIIGCFLMVTNGELGGISFSLIGVLLGVNAGFLYGLVTIVGKFAADNVKPIAFSFYGFFFGSIVLAVLCRPWETIPQVSSPKFWLLSIGYGLVSTLIPYLLYFTGLSMVTELARVPVIASVETVISVLIGLMIFSEPWGMFKFIGIVGVMASIVLINMKSSSTTETETDRRP